MRHCSVCPFYRAPISPAPVLNPPERETKTAPSCDRSPNAPLIDSRRPRLHFRNNPAQLRVSCPDIRVQGGVGYDAGDLVEVGNLVRGNAVEFCGLAQVIHLRAVFHHRAFAVGLDVAGGGQAEFQVDAVGAQKRLGKMQLEICSRLVLPSMVRALLSNCRR